MKQEDVLQELSNFLLYWELDLSVRLLNAEMMRTYQPRSDCKNAILCELIDAYIFRAIEINLIKIYEALEMIEKLEHDYRKTEKTVERLIDYRNKLHVHKEMNRKKQKTRDLESLFVEKSDRIYTDIREGVSKIKSWLEGKDCYEISSQATTHPHFVREDFSNLIKSVPIHQFET